MKVGDYVRTIKGISKIKNIIDKYDYIFCKTDNELGNCTYSSNGVGYYFHKEDKDKIILKSVPNIIDLIEYGDIVKYKIDDENFISEVWGEKNNYFVQNFDVPIDLRDLNIISIVTKEQFESIKYEVE